MASASRFTEISCIEYEIVCSEDNLVDDELAEPEGSIQIYVTASRQWETSDKIKVKDPLVFLAKIQSLVTQVYSARLGYVDLLDTTDKFIHLNSVLEQLTNMFHVPAQLCDLKEEIMSILDKGAAEIKRQKPKEFEIEIFVDILAKQFCSEQEFKEKYAKLFQGTNSAAFMRTSKFLEQEDLKEETFCALCLEKLNPGVDRLIIMPCSDMFHEMCIGGWLNGRSNTCPDCCWSPAGKLPESSPGLLQAKQLFDQIQDLESQEKEVPEMNVVLI